MARPKTPESPPLWRALFTQLHSCVLSGTLPGGSKLATEKELCLEHGVSRITVRRALRELELLGLLKRQRGSGTVVVSPRVDGQPRLIHVVMSPSGHVLSDLHLALMSRLGELGFSHQTWAPGVAGAENGPEALAAVPARGTIIIPWQVPVAAYKEQAARLGRLVAIVPDAGNDHDMPGFGVEFQTPIRDLLTLSRQQGIRSVLHLTYRMSSPHRNSLASTLMTECVEQGHTLSLVATFDTGDLSEMGEMRAAIAAATKPVLIFCASDFIAISVRRLVETMNLDIPEEVAIVGIYNTQHSQIGNLSTICVRPKELVHGAIALILDDRDNMAFTRLPGKLLIRGSGPGRASA